MKLSIQIFIFLLSWFCSYANTGLNIFNQQVVLVKICKSVGKYCDQTEGVDNQARYNQGKAIFNVASAFIGVGEIKAILNGEKTLLEVVNASQQARYYESYDHSP